MRQTVLLCLLMLGGFAPVGFARTDAHGSGQRASSSAGGQSGGQNSGGHSSKNHSSKGRSSGRHSHRRPHGTARRSSGSHAGTKHRVGHGQSRQRPASAARERDAKIKRRQDARAEFQRAYPCPSTGKTGGACPGYVVDHIVPLNRGGADTALNMQWQAEGVARPKATSD